jgi:hypothetical protein
MYFALASCEREKRERRRRNTCNIRIVDLKNNKK